MEGMELSAAEQQGQDITMCSPEKDMCTGFSFTQSEEPKTHQMDVLSSDLASIDKNPLDTPMLDGELPFTPVKNNVQNFAAAETLSDLIVFSPLSSSAEK